MIAALGDMTRVDTTVAIALGASVHPLTKMEQAIRNKVKIKITFIGIILLVESIDTHKALFQKRQNTWLFLGGTSKFYDRTDHKSRSKKLSFKKFYIQKPKSLCSSIIP